MRLVSLGQSFHHLSGINLSQSTVLCFRWSEFHTKTLTDKQLFPCWPSIDQSTKQTNQFR